MFNGHIVFGAPKQQRSHGDSRQAYNRHHLINVFSWTAATTPAMAGRKKEANSNK